MIASSFGKYARNHSTIVIARITVPAFLMNTHDRLPIVRTTWPTFGFVYAGSSSTKGDDLPLNIVLRSTNAAPRAATIESTYIESRASPSYPWGTNAPMSSA